MPFTTISRKIVCKDSLPLCSLPPLSASLSTSIPLSVSYYEVIIIIFLINDLKLHNHPVLFNKIQI